MAHAATLSKASDQVIQLVTFRLQEETYCINVMQVQEVLRVS
jgi:chemotaxis signal transduction protein